MLKKIRTCDSCKDIINKGEHYYELEKLTNSPTITTNGFGYLAGATLTTAAISSDRETSNKEICQLCYESKLNL